MKKILMALFLIAGISSLSHADSIFGGNVRDRSFTLHFSTALPAATTSAQFLLIDLSSTTIFPHTETGYAVISNARIVVDKAAATTANVRLGVITRVNLSSGTVNWFYSSNQTNNVSNTMSLIDSNPYESLIKLKVNGASINSYGTTPFLVTNEQTLDSTVYRSSTSATLPTFFSPVTAIGTPDAGDIVLDISKAASAATVVVDLMYYVERR